MTAHLEARKARGELKEETTEAQMTARKRMALLPVKHSEALFVQVRFRSFTFSICLLCSSEELL